MVAAVVAIREESESAHTCVVDELKRAHEADLARSLDELKRTHEEDLARLLNQGRTKAEQTAAQAIEQAVSSERVRLEAIHREKVRQPPSYLLCVCVWVSVSMCVCVCECVWVCVRVSL